jgi:hypothetical protein
LIKELCRATLNVDPPAPAQNTHRREGRGGSSIYVGLERPDEQMIWGWCWASGRMLVRLARHGKVAGQYGGN